MTRLDLLNKIRSRHNSSACVEDIFTIAIRAVAAGVTAAGISLITQPVTAATRSAELGTVRAEYTDETGEACLENPKLKITRAEQVAFDQVLTGEELCRQDADVFAVQDLDGDEEPEVILDFSSGGAHCCSSSLIFRYDPRSETYTSIQHLWGEGYGARRREDLDGDGLPELIHYDSRFAYAFTSYAGSGMPIRIWQYRQGEMTNVTRNYRQQVFDDAYKWWKLYTEAEPGTDVRGILAAYLADKHLLGEAEDGWKRLEQIYKGSDRVQFFANLREFLAESGYVVNSRAAAPPPLPNRSLIRRPTDPPTPTLSDAESTVLLAPQNTALTAGDTILQLDKIQAGEELEVDEILQLSQSLQIDQVLQIDGTLYDQFTFCGKAGQQVKITLESTEFDPYLILVDPNQTILAENDDWDANSQNSQLIVVLPQAGTYTVVANAYRKEGRGQYTLVVRGSIFPDEETGSTETIIQPSSANTLISTQCERSQVDLLPPSS